jgi:hypothetical protein
MIEGIHTKQDLFDHVARHLFKQHAKATIVVNDKMPCRYRTSDGFKCAIGCLIDDDNYSEGLERRNVLSIRGAIEKSIGRQLSGDEYSMAGKEINILYRLQRIHDHHEVREWPQLLYTTAEEYGLKFNFTEDDWKECVA